MKTQIKQGKLVSIEDAISLINKGHEMALFASEKSLNKMPRGNWIGATECYFYLKDENGRLEEDMVFVNDFTNEITEIRIETYSESNLHQLCLNGFENGFNFLLFPIFSKTHHSFWKNALNYEKLYQNPLIGMVAGYNLGDKPENHYGKVYNGFTGTSSKDDSVVMHCGISSNRSARVEIVNIFEADSNSSVYEVEEDSIVIKECLIDGVKTKLSDHLIKINYDTKSPFTADYSGAMINSSFLGIDKEKGEVLLYAPLIKGKKYRLTKKFDNYAVSFREKMNEALQSEKNIVFNCNCILNYLYGELDKKDIGFSGPAPFGEIAYTPVNQTFTYLAIDEI